MKQPVFRYCQAAVLSILCIIDCQAFICAVPFSPPRGPSKYHYFISKERETYVK